MSDLNNISEWTIFIDDIQGELAMTKAEWANGRNIDVLAKEEVVELIESLQAQLTQERERRESAEADLNKAIQYLKEGKVKFAPNTTNSFVDDLIAKYEPKEPK